MVNVLPTLSDEEVAGLRSPETAGGADPDSGFGALSTEKGCLPLRALSVRARLDGLLARVEVVQTFVNPHAERLEATYIFPLPYRAAVTGFRLEVAGRVVEAELRERGQARREYDRAVQAGHRAAIAEEERPGVFTLRFGNLPSGETATVRLSLVGPRPYRDGEVTFRFPLVVAPRYVPGSALAGPPVGAGVADDTDSVPDASRISPPVLLPGFPNPVRLDLSVEVPASPLAPHSFRSSLHTVSEGQGGGRALFRLRPGERLDRDFVLRYRLGADRVHTSLCLQPDPGGDEGTFLLTVVPPAEEPGRPSRPRHRLRAGPLREHGGLEDGGGAAGRDPHGRVAGRARPLRRVRLRRPHRDPARLRRHRPGGRRRPAALPGRRVPGQGRGPRRHRDGEAPGGGRRRADARPAGGRARARPGADHRRAGGQRGPDPAAARGAGPAGAHLHAGDRPGGQRRLPAAAGRPGRRLQRGGRDGGPPRRGDGLRPPAHRHPRTDGAEPGAGGAGLPARDPGARPAARPVRWRPALAQRPLPRLAVGLPPGAGEGRRRGVVVHRGARLVRPGRPAGPGVGAGPGARAGGPLRRGRRRPERPGGGDNRDLAALRGAVPVHGAGGGGPGRGGQPRRAGPPRRPAGRTAPGLGRAGGAGADGGRGSAVCPAAARTGVEGRGDGPARRQDDARVGGGRSVRRGGRGPLRGASAQRTAAPRFRPDCAQARQQGEEGGPGARPRRRGGGPATWAAPESPRPVPPSGPG